MIQPSQPNDSKFLVIIPAYNEAASLGSLVGELLTLHPSLEILLVNDGSTDSTERVGSELSKTNTRFHALSHPVNLGIGRSVQSGLIYAAQKGFRFAVQCDGDGQHPPSEVLKLVDRAFSLDSFDVVIGSRFCDGNSKGFRSSAARRLGIKYFSYLIFLLTGQRVFDTTSGFRVFNRRAIELLSKYYPEDYPEPESIIFLLKNKMIVREFPVEMRERTGGSSSINLKKSIYYMIKVSLAVFMQAMRRPFRGIA